MEQNRIIATEVDKSLPVPLSESDVDDYARQLASEVDALANMDEDKKEAAKRFTVLRKKQNDLVLDLTRKVQTKQDFRLVRCEVLHDYRERVVETVRRDTNETVETRPMTRAEYERGMQTEF